MKKLITILVLLILAFSCKNDKGLTLTGENYHLTVKIDGINHSFNNRLSLKSITELSHIINGKNKDKEEGTTRITLGLNIENNTTGTFKLSDNSDMVFVYHSHFIYLEKRTYYIWHAKDSAKGSTGTITITKNNDTYIEGTFTFKGIGMSKLDTSVKKFTEGSFKIKK